MRIQLRREQDWREVERFLDNDESERLSHRASRATALVKTQGDRLRALAREGHIDEFRHMQLDATLTELYTLQGQAERIKNTPMARQYDYFTWVFVNVFIVVLPFGVIGLLPTQPLLVGVISLIVSFVFFVLHSIGRLNEDPFEGRIQDTPMSALCRTIEIDLRDMLDEDELPEPLQPVNGFLL